MTGDLTAHEGAAEPLDARPILDGLLDAARDGMSKSTWKIGDPDETLLLPIAGHVMICVLKWLEESGEPVSPRWVRSQVAAELRESAQRHPQGTARHSAFMEAARLAETGPVG